MCGICGELCLSGEPVASDDTVQRMLQTMVHRGPDDEGIYVDGPLAMGMRRLSIIDLSGGHQPIFSEDRSKVIVFNGEIYNHIELRRDLQERGHVFSTNSDTEVILHLFEDKGVNCLDQLNGIFAFALWDATRRTLLLARDRLGIKPLHVARTPTKLVFASELNALMQSPDVDPTVDPMAVDDFFTYFYLPGARSIYKSVEKVRPGHYQMWRDGRLNTGKCWTAPNAVVASKRRPIEFYVHGFWEQLKRSVSLQLRSDVPVGVFLSGGLDSSAVVAAAAEVSGCRLDTFTVGFDSPTYDERRYARATAERYGTRHHELVIGPDDLLRTGELLGHFGEPYGPFTIAQAYAISSFSRDYVKVALAGDGGDELFGGYQTYVASSVASWYLKLPKWVRRAVVSQLAQWLPVSDRLMTVDYKVREFVRGVELFPHAGNMAWKIIFNGAERERLFTEDFRRAIPHREEYAFVAELLRKAPTGSALHKAMYTDLAMFLPDAVLTQTDRMSMAASQEVRVPMLDHEMVEFAASVPDRFKCHAGRTKILVRKALKGRLPSEVANKTKTGFTTPVAAWLRQELKEFVSDTLCKHRLEDTGIFNATYVHRLLEDHLKRRADHSRRIWSLVSFMLWWEHSGSWRNARSTNGECCWGRITSQV